MVDHVTKPIDPEQLVQAIRRHLASGAPAAPGTALGEPGPAGLAPAATVACGVVDWPGLLQRFGGRRDFILKLVTLAARTQADTPTRLRQAAESGDTKVLAFQAHSLKGVAGDLGAHAVYGLALATEQAAHDGSPEVVRLARDLAEVTERLLAELAERSWPPSGPA
jgi:two-component system, sensor histidine kinase and response regulator